MNEKPKNWWNYVRDIELKPALEFFPKNKNIKILEVGGGNGYQAQKISEMGYSINSIDVFPREPLYFQVEKIDVTKLPYPDKSYDLILTSLVLQHIENIDDAFNQMNRVLKDDGIMIHILPTYWWSIFTNFWHYCYIPKYLIQSISKRYKPNLINNVDNSSSNIVSMEKIDSKIKNLFLHPLGYNPSFVHEIFIFRKNNWKKLLQQHSLQIIAIKNCPISSTGYAVLKNKLLKARKFFALHYFPTIICIVVKKS